MVRSYHTEKWVQTSESGFCVTRFSEQINPLDHIRPVFRREPFRFSSAVPLAIFVIVMVSGCGHRTYTAQPPAPAPIPSAPSAPPPPIERQPAVPGEYVEQGVASWYGVPFDGRRTSNGEIYDMREFTAAHRTLPFGAVVRVTNLANGMQTEVRINDRGPFVANRIIDLSQAAARAIAMVGTGTASVRLEIISGPNPNIGFFGVQVGAFLVQDNADRLKSQLAVRYSPVNVVPFDLPNGRFYRVRVGRVPSQQSARQLADQLHSDEQLTTFVVRIDE
jgi:rare lipoprotein A